MPRRDVEFMDAPGANVTYERRGHRFRHVSSRNQTLARRTDCDLIGPLQPAVTERESTVSLDHRRQGCRCKRRETTMRSERVLCVAVLLAVLLTASTTTGVAKAGVTSAQAHVAAVWQPQIVKFEYRAGNTLYTCRSLQRKIERILLQIGTRERAR